MDGMTLLREARAQGLTVAAEGERLTIRGPRQADGAARLLLAHKPAILDAMALERIGEIIEDARRKGPEGTYGESLRRVVAIYWAIALEHRQRGDLAGHAAGLEKCIRDAVRNANGLDKMTMVVDQKAHNGYHEGMKGRSS